MIKSFKFLLALVFSTAFVQAQQTPYFASDPDISPDGRSVYFSFDGDIWKVPSAGGEALRIVAMEGTERAPRVSPDGKWLAFTSNQYGNNDVFVLNFESGEIKQLTFHQSSDVVKSWSWDSNTIYFTSDRYNFFGSYSVPVSGGTAVPLFDQFFSTSDEIFPMPSGGYVFTNSREVNSQRERKNYKGPYNPDLLFYNPQTDEYKKLTTYEGKDFNPTIDRNGNVYFISDQINNEYNLHTLRNGKSVALTQFDSSIKSPQVSANGEKVVFERDYQLYLYDVKSQQTSKIEFSAAKHFTLDKDNSFNTGNISTFDVSPDGKKMAFVSRGILFVSDTEGEFIKEILNDGERVMEVKWLKDNKNLLITKTYKGFPNLYKIPAVGGEVEALTQELRSNRDLSFNYDLSKAVYLSGRDEVRLLDLKKFDSKTIVKDELWAFQNSAPSFSPDGKYVLFTAVRDFEKDVFIHNIKEEKTYNLTNTGVSEADPYWSPDGKYIYYASNRTEPAYPFGMRDATIYRMAMNWYPEEFIEDGFEKLFDDKKKDKSDKDDDKKESKKKPDPVKINFDGLKDRIERVSKRFGSQNDPKVFQIDEKTIVFYNSNEDGGKYKLYKKTYEPYKEAKEEKVTDSYVNDIIYVNKQFYFASRDGISKYNLNSNKTDKIKLNHKFEKNLEKEFAQMFEETWAGIDENFYDETFHGRDWKALKAHYAQFVPFVNNRNDLRVLLNDMLGELNASHLGFRSTGDEEKTKLNYVTAETGILFQKDNPYLVDRIVYKSPGMTLNDNIKPNDKLVEINGLKINDNENRNKYFTFPESKKELRLGFERKGKAFYVNSNTLSFTNQRNLIYDEWIETNRKNVKDWSGDRIGYTYMKNMSGDQLEAFLLDMVDKANDKEGLIVDLRFNLGGNVHDKVLSFLAQKPYMQWKYREGRITVQGNFGPSAHPIVLLINEVSLSDAEMTSAGFRELNLGKIIGTPTYRWIIFTSSKSLVDGSNYRVPAWGVYTMDGKNLELEGVEPDIRVDNTFLDYLKGNDPQLRRAVDEILKEL